MAHLSQSSCRAAYHRSSPIAESPSSVDDDVVWTNVNRIGRDDAIESFEDVIAYGTKFDVKQSRRVAC